MSAKINIPQFFQHLTDGVKVADVNGNTVGECLTELVNQFPSVKERLFYEDGKLLSPVGIYINGESAYPEELAKPVNDGDEIQIMLVIAGG